MVPAMLGRSAQPRFVRALAAGAFAAAVAAPVAAQEVAPVVVELYTSQGCNSCPPADAFLGELARRPGVVALSFHVDYWNYLGWQDPYSNKKFTYRQREYAMSFRQTGVYTPQMVIQGRRGEVGSDRPTVLQAIAEASRAKPGCTVLLEKRDGSRLHATITAAAGAQGAEIWVALFDREHTTKILRGENEGITLKNYHVVREWKRLGEVGGAKTELDLVAAGEKGEKRSGAAVIVQQPRAGPILGAAFILLD